MNMCSLKTMADMLAQQPNWCSLELLFSCVRVRPCDHEARLSVCSDSQRACWEYKNTQHDRVGSTRAPGHVHTKQAHLWAKQPVNILAAETSYSYFTRGGREQTTCASVEGTPVMNPPTTQDTKHGLKSCTHYIRRVVLKNTGVSSGSMSETRVVSAASDSCSGACNSGAHVQHAEQGDAIGG